MLSADKEPSDIEVTCDNMQLCLDSPARFVRIPMRRLRGCAIDYIGIFIYASTLMYIYMHVCIMKTLFHMHIYAFVHRHVFHMYIYAYVCRYVFHMHIYAFSRAHLRMHVTKTCARAGFLVYGACVNIYAKKLLCIHTTYPY